MCGTIYFPNTTIQEISCIMLYCDIFCHIVSKISISPTTNINLTKSYDILIQKQLGCKKRHGQVSKVESYQKDWQQQQLISECEHSACMNNIWKHHIPFLKHLNSPVLLPILSFNSLTREHGSENYLSFGCLFIYTRITKIMNLKKEQGLTLL